MRSLRSRSFERKQKAKRLFDILFFSKIKRKKVYLEWLYSEAFPLFPFFMNMNIYDVNV